MEEQKTKGLGVCLSIIGVLIAATFLGLGLAFAYFGLGSDALNGFFVAIGVLGFIPALIGAKMQEKGAADKEYCVKTSVICVIISLVLGLLVGFGACSCSEGVGGSGKTCQFTRNGEKVCSMKATHGDLCEYHFNLLDDTYNDLIDGGWGW